MAFCESPSPTERQAYESSFFDSVFFSATDIANSVAGRRLLTLKLDATEGKVQRRYFRDPSVC